MMILWVMLVLALLSCLGFSTLLRFVAFHDKAPPLSLEVCVVGSAIAFLAVCVLASTIFVKYVFIPG
jgi:hypothetical protein